jgi:HEAT repeat protein
MLLLLKVGIGMSYPKILVRVLVLLILATAAVAPAAVSAADGLQGIREDLNSIHWEVRLAALERLRNARDEDSVNLLLAVANTKAERTSVKITAIELLGEAGDPRAIEVLLPIFNDATLNWDCPAIKTYTAVALGSFRGDKRVVDALISGLSDPELLTREASIRSLGRIGSRRAVPLIMRALNDKHVSIRLSAIKALGEIGSAMAIPELQGIAETDTDPVVKNQAKMALGKLQQR